MIKNLKFKISNSRGMTLIEIVVVIFIIVVFTMIVIVNFPKIQRQYALSAVVYKLAQDLRKTQDLALSGVPLKNGAGDTIPVQGYGVYISTTSKTQYIIYADVPDGILSDNQKFVNTNNICVIGGTSYSYLCCSQETFPFNRDCVIDIIDLSKQNSSLSIDSFSGIGSSTYTSINFSPPNPKTAIDYLNSDKVGIILKNTDGSNRTIFVNTSGLIYVQ